MSILDLFCPFSCQQCGALGRPLCACCKKHIIETSTSQCNLSDYLETDWQDLNGPLPFSHSFNCGWRDETLGQLVEKYKYESTRAIGLILGEILDGVLPDLGDNIIVVPLPTIAKHIRARGFDHTLKIAKQLAQRRHWQCQKLLVRTKNTVQVGANRQQRQSQVDEAYGLANHQLSSESCYLLLDDVWTTGASLCAATKVLQEAGIKKHQIMSTTLVTSR